MKLDFTSLMEGINDRALYGLLFIAAIIGYEAISRLDNLADQYQITKMQQQRKASHADENIDVALWEQRAANLNLALDAQRAKFWQGESVRALAAKLQQDLEKGVREINSGRNQIRVDAEPVAIGSHQGLRFSLNSQLRQSSDVVSVISLLTSFQPALLTDQLSLTFNRNGTISVIASGVAPLAEELTSASTAESQTGAES